MKKNMKNRPELSASMSVAEFDNGYWYATELQAFAIELGVPSASALRKDGLEEVIKHFLRSGAIKASTKRRVPRSGVKDVDRGLRPELPIVNYTSNKETKDFILREARKLDPDFKRKSGTRYLLNRWREEQLAQGKRITYRDLAKQAIVLNATKTGPLRIEHGRYINFISDFMAANRKATHKQAAAAWHELKGMDAPKTYASWAGRRQGRGSAPRRRRAARKRQ
jgi:hypothetical protein